MNHPVPSNSSASFTDLPDDAFVREPVLVPNRVLPISRGTLWRWVREGRFVKPVKLSDQVTAWRVGDVRQWLASRG